MTYNKYRIDQFSFLACRTDGSMTDCSSQPMTCAICAKSEALGLEIVGWLTSPQQVVHDSLGCHLVIYHSSSFVLGTIVFFRKKIIVFA